MFDPKSLTAQSTLDQILAEHYAIHFPEERQRGLSASFRRMGYVKISDIIPDAIKQEMREEAFALLRDHAIRRDTRIRETGYSRRTMSNVHSTDIEKHGRVIPTIYDSTALRRFLGRLALGFFGRPLSAGEWQLIDEEVITCPYEKEKFLINQQSFAGDTHGWHWGDYAYTIIWVVEAPPIEKGGLLQCIPHTTWDKDNVRLFEHLVDQPITSYYHASGDVYFLKSDTTLHRTVPLTEDATRVIVNTCWGSKADAYKLVDHGTMEAAFTDDKVS